MPPNDAAPEADKSLAYTYEAVFCVFMIAIALLGRETAAWAHPWVLYLLALLLGLNLAAGASLRRWPGKRGLSAAVVVGNCAVITAILEQSGGRDSRLWVLYLLPVFTSSMFLRGGEVLLVAAGAIGFNASFCLLSGEPLGASSALDLGLRSGILALAAALTWRMAEREGRARLQLALQRRQLDGLLGKAEDHKAQDDATRRLAEVGLVTAGVLHDLKTPLTVILGFADIGLRAGDAESMRADFERIRKAGLVCRDIVSQVLALSGRVEPRLEECDLREIMLSTLSLCASVFEHKGIAVSVVVPEGPLPVRGSPQQLQRLFLNLLTNAAQALKDSGTVRLEARMLSSGGGAGFDRVEASVADDGPGLSEKALAGLFKAFSTTRSEQGGTGLGLYVCREIASTHGGTLVAENRPGGGARFSFTLPLLAAPVAAGAAA